MEELKLKRISESELHTLDSKQTFKETIASLTATIRNIEIINISTAHTADMNPLDIKPALSTVKRDMAEDQILLGTVMANEINADLRYLKSSDDNKEHLTAFADDMDLTFRLSVLEDSKSEEYYNNLYPGELIYKEYDSDPYLNHKESGFIFDLKVCKKQMNSILTALRSDTKATLTAGMHIHCYSDKQLFKSTIILRNSWRTNCFLGFARVTSEHGLHITDSNNQSEPRTAIDHKSPEQVLSETIVRKLQSNNRLLQICVIIASIALGIAIF